MTAVNKVISYSAVSSIQDVLDALETAFTTGGANELGWTLVESQTVPTLGDGTQYFVVENQKPSNLFSRMLLEVRHANISAVDYIAFVLSEAPWTNAVGASPGGTKGSALSRVQCTDPAVSEATTPANRFHRLDLTNGGTFYLDGDDTIGKWLAVHSEFGSPTPDSGTRSPLGHFIAVCSIEADGPGSNYGILFATSGGANENSSFRGDSNSNSGGWSTPRNHIGADSNSHRQRTDLSSSPTGWNRTSIRTGGPMHLEGGGTGGSEPFGGMVEVDTYNTDDLFFPIFVGNYKRGTQLNPPGYRGILHGIFTYRKIGGAWRQLFTSVDGNNLRTYAMAPDAPASDIPVLAVPAP